MSQVPRLLKLSVLVPLLAGLIACAGDPSKPTQVGPSSLTSTPLGPSEPSPIYGMASPSTIAAVPDAAPIADDDYRVSSQDVINVAVFQVPDLSRTVQVDGTGHVTLPLVNRVPVRGKTILQVQEDIAARYRRSYLQSPQVTVSLVKSGQRVTVNGAVKAPRVLTVEGKLTLGEAIAQSGGLSELANAQRVHIARMSGQRVDDQIHDLDEVHAGRAPNPVLQGGDIVVVEEANSKLALKTVKDILPLAIIGSFLSDARVKRDIIPVGRENGLQLYRHRFAWSDTLYVGVMAQEVLEVAPNAVLKGKDGYLRVDYGRLGLRLQRWEDWLASHPPEAAADYR